LYGGGWKRWLGTSCAPTGDPSGQTLLDEKYTNKQKQTNKLAQKDKSNIDVFQVNQVFQVWAMIDRLT
jgi:hypothetical protein